MNKLKIAVVGTRGFPHVQGGIESHCEHLYTTLARNGCDITVFTRTNYVDPSLKSYKDIRLVALTCPKNRFLETIVHTFKSIFVAKAIKCNILHIHGIGPSLFAPLARLVGLKVVMTNHGPDYERKKWKGFAKSILKTGERLGSQWANGIICISQNISDHIKKQYHKDSVIIPNGVIIHHSVHGEAALEKFNINKGKYILAVGRFVPEKGFHDLIEAFEHTKKDGWKLVIVGDADHEDGYSLGLKERAKKNENIVLTGQLKGEDLREIYSHAGIFILPSYYEGLPIVLLEAMSYGLSCIIADIPATREVNIDAERYFRAGDIKGIDAKIGEFIKKPLNKEERDQQVDYVEWNFNWELIAVHTLDVYEDCLKA